MKAPELYLIDGERVHLTDLGDDGRHFLIETKNEAIKNAIFDKLIQYGAINLSMPPEGNTLKCLLVNNSKSYAMHSGAPNSNHLETELAVTIHDARDALEALKKDQKALLDLRDKRAGHAYKLGKVGSEVKTNYKQR